MTYDISDHRPALGSIEDVFLWLVLKWRAQYTIAYLTEMMKNVVCVLYVGDENHTDTHLSKVIPKATSNDVWCVETQEGSHRLRITVSSDAERVSLHTSSNPFSSAKEL